MTDFTARLSDLNDAMLGESGLGEVRYTISAAKSYNYEGDVLASMSTDLTFQCMADTLDLDTLDLPWAEKHVTWLASGSFRFVACEIEPVQSARVANLSRWRETYRKVSGEAASSLPTYFDVIKTVELPVWIAKFHYWNNKRLGLGNDEATARRMRQVFGLSPVQGEITARTFQPIADDTDPYSFLNTTFANFDGMIKSAVVTKALENGKMVYTLNLSWTGGKVGAGALPAYTI